MTEALIPRAITPMTQSLEASCVPTSISMVFSGFGLDIPAETLIDNYFPTARLPQEDPDSGVNSTNTLHGTLQVIKDRGLTGSLQLDVFAPSLHEHTYSSEQRFIVRAEPGAIRQHARQFKEGRDTRELYETLGRLAKSGEVGVYTANSKMLKLPRRLDMSHRMPEEIRAGFYRELEGFIKKGHIIGPHGGMTNHMRALDGTIRKPLDYRPEEDGFPILDPGERSYVVSLSSLVWVDSLGVRGDVFDYLIRISPREESPELQPRGFRGLIHGLRYLIP